METLCSADNIAMKNRFNLFFVLISNVKLCTFKNNSYKFFTCSPKEEEECESTNTLWVKKKIIIFFGSVCLVYIFLKCPNDYIFRREREIIIFT